SSGSYTSKPLHPNDAGALPFGRQYHDRSPLCTHTRRLTARRHAYAAHGPTPVPTPARRYASGCGGRLTTRLGRTCQEAMKNERALANYLAQASCVGLGRGTRKPTVIHQVRIRSDSLVFTECSCELAAVRHKIY